MLTAQELKKKIEANQPEVVVVSVKDYGNDLLATYAARDNSRLADPFILADKQTGKMQYYSIAEDPDRYYSTPNLL